MRVAVGHLSSAATAFTAAEQATLEAARAGGKPFTAKQRRTIIDIAVTSILSPPDDPSNPLAGWAASDDLDEPAKAAARAFLKMLDDLRPFADYSRDDLVRMLRGLAPDPDRKPGTYLQHTLKYQNRQNLHRDATASDVVDSFHVQFIPYVDVFTTDGDNIARLRGAFADIRCRRAGRVFQNRRLLDVAMTLRELAAKVGT